MQDEVKFDPRADLIRVSDKKGPCFRITNKGEIIYRNHKGRTIKATCSKRLLESVKVMVETILKAANQPKL